MSKCPGKYLCNIYRDKKYCRKREDKENGYDGVCMCRHAILPCKAEESPCFFRDICNDKESPSVEELFARRLGLGRGSARGETC